MNGEQKTASLVTLAICVALIVCVFIMARCSVDTARVQTEAAECVKSGGTWHVADPGRMPSYCEAARK